MYSAGEMEIEVVKGELEEKEEEAVVMKRGDGF